MPIDPKLPRIVPTEAWYALAWGALLIAGANLYLRWQDTRRRKHEVIAFDPDRAREAWGSDR